MDDTHFGTERSETEASEDDLISTLLDSEDHLAYLRNQVVETADRILMTSRRLARLRQRNGGDRVVR